MSGQNWDKVKRVFGELIDVSIGDRAAYLDAACGSDLGLRREIESLLAEHAHDEGLSSESLSDRFPAPAKAEDHPGAVIGPYQLIDQIGEGGFGSVFVAQQDQPVRRKVAVKIIKLGMDTRQVIARFEAERQALAIMDHPGIARVFDAGATPTGRPYFVMELVNGLPVTEYCDAEELDVRGRIEVFIAICQAIQHAHQKGVIHRDIKPSNILVAKVDDRPAVKVIDFGIAKATQETTPLHSQFTDAKQMIGTPKYMSPEQAGSGLDVDTRTDVYSLGILLYELLTGATPFDSAKLRYAPYEGIQRMIREVEPPRPSTRLSSLRESSMAGQVKPLGRKVADSSEVRLQTPSPRKQDESGDHLHTPPRADATDAHEISSRRQTDPARLVRILRGDLDWIVMKAIEKDRARRYESVGEFGADLLRYLRNEPVSAGPPGAAYRVRKFARRHAGVLTAAGVVFVALIAGGIATTAALLRAQRAEVLAKERLVDVEAARQTAELATIEESRQRKKAETSERAALAEAETTDQVSSFLKDMLRGVGPGVARGRDTTLLREILEQTEERMAVELKDQPQVEGEVRTALAEVYRDLGLLPRAQENEERAVMLLSQVHPGAHVDVATAINSLGRIKIDRGDLDGAEADLNRALEMRKTLFGEENGDVAVSLRYLGELHRQRGDFVRAEQDLGDAIAMMRKYLGEESIQTASTLSDYANVLLDQGKYADAVTTLREAMVLQQKIWHEHPLLATTMSNLATALYMTLNSKEAEPIAREALALRRKLLGEEHLDTAASKGSLGLVLNALGKLDESEQMVRGQIATITEIDGADSSLNASPMLNLAGYLSDKGAYEESAGYFEKAIANFRTNLGPRHPRLGAALGAYVSSLYIQGKYEAAEKVAREQMPIEGETLPADHPGAAGTKVMLSGIITEQIWPAITPDNHSDFAARAAEAETFIRDGMSVRAKHLPPDHWVMFNTRGTLGAVLATMGATAEDTAVALERYKEAEALLNEAYDGLIERADSITPQHRDRVIRKCIERGVHLYENWQRIESSSAIVEKLKIWQSRLDDLSKSKP